MALEHELGFDVFVRNGRVLARVTPAGRRVVTHAREIVREERGIEDISAEFRHTGRGSLSIGTTHTQARYVLPPMIQWFRSVCPAVEFHLHQGSSKHIAEMARMERIKLAIATESHELFDGYVRLPWYHWHCRVIVPLEHPLACVGILTLEHLAEFPLVNYVFSVSGRSELGESFRRVGLHPKVALTARDADVIKAYVRLGLGMELRRQPVLLTDVLERALETSRPFIDSREHELVLDLAASELCVNGDPDRLAQVFSNLLFNSAKYTLAADALHSTLTVKAVSR
jgi:LysR family cys regulon transcriptional activator